MRSAFFGGAALLLAALVVGCGSGDGARYELVVLGAASLTDVLADLEAEFEQAHPDVAVTVSVAGTNELREQLLAGAPADVFVSANEDYLLDLAERGLVAEPRPLARTPMVVAVARGNPAGVNDLSALEASELNVGLCEPAVPCGTWTETLLEDLEVSARPDTLEPNVRSLATKLGAGELDVAVLYRSDVVASGGDLEAVPLADADVVATSYIAVVTRSDDAEAALSFVELATSPDSANLLANWGFDTP